MSVVRITVATLTDNGCGLDAFPGTAGVSPATYGTGYRPLGKTPRFKGSFALRARCGRDARGPRKSVEAAAVVSERGNRYSYNTHRSNTSGSFA